MSSTRPWFALLWASSLFGVAVLATGCAPSAREAARTEADAIRREATPRRMESSGDAAARRGEMTRAEEYYLAARELGGDERELTQKVVAVCSADERYPVAVRYATEYLAKHPEDTEMRFAAAALLAAIGDTAAARVAYERVVLEQPNLAEAHYALAMLLREEETGNADALAHLRAYLTLQPRGAYAESARAAIRGRVP